MQPKWEPPIIPFSFNIWSDTKACIKTLCLNFLHESYYILSSAKIVLTRLRLMNIPKCVCLDYVQPSFFGFCY
nr:hypothetical protein Iba_chr13cCG7120 [Ipomoea batatas]